MKNRISIFFKVVTLIILVTSCSSDDKKTNVETDFASFINVNFVAFNPNKASNTLFTILESNINNGEANKRTFYMKKNANGTQGLQDMQLSVTYPSSQSSIAGVYNLSASITQSNSIATGIYQDSNNSYIFKAGTLTVIELGTKRYKLVFDNAKIGLFTSSIELPVTGYCEGTFF
jgi:hypothetical protein